jgi:hypothetical protein
MITSFKYPLQILVCVALVAQLGGCIFARHDRGSQDQAVFGEHQNQERDDRGQAEIYTQGQQQ